MNIKLYSFGDVDFYAAKNLRDAVKEYIYMTGCTRREALEEARELSEAELDRFTFVDDVYNPDESDKRSFREQLHKEILAGESFPKPFASSEY